MRRPVSWLSIGWLPNVQGQTAARNMLRYREKFTVVPFFWSQHYDVSISYVGHAQKWDELVIEGRLHPKTVFFAFKNRGKTRAVASIFREVDRLQAELAKERVCVVS